MADKVPITVALYGFSEEQEPFMQSAFAQADKWAAPWIITKDLEKARVIIVYLASEDDYEGIENLKHRLPKAEIVTFSAKKPPHSKWHLERQTSGKVSVVGFSQLVLKISHTLKRNSAGASSSKSEAVASMINPNNITQTGLSTLSDAEELEQEPSDLLNFFDQLDSLMDTKPNEKRKRFNEK